MKRTVGSTSWIIIINRVFSSRVNAKLVHDDGANLLLTQHRQQKFIRRINQRNTLARDVRYNLNIFQLISIKARTADLSYVSSVPSSSLSLFFFFLSTPLYFSCFTCSMGMYSRNVLHRKQSKGQTGDDVFSYRKDLGIFMYIHIYRVLIFVIENHFRFQKANLKIYIYTNLFIINVLNLDVRQKQCITEYIQR